MWTCLVAVLATTLTSVPRVVDAVPARKMLAPLKPNSGPCNGLTHGPNGFELDELCEEKTKWYIRPGHINDGNEGNEGNEGSDEPNPNDGNEGNEGDKGEEGTPDTPPPRPPPSTPPSGSGRCNGLTHGPNGFELDELCEEKTKWYIRQGHTNDGNEGNEGNEGSHEPHPNDGNEGNEGDEGEAGTPDTPPPRPPPSTPPSGSGRCNGITHGPNGFELDEVCEEKTKWYIRPGHSNDGNEGNEGNEGSHEPHPNDGNEGNEGDEGTAGPPPTTLEVPPPGPWRPLKPLPASMGEVSAGVVSSEGKDYLVVVGEHPSGDPKNGVTMVYDFDEDVWFEGGKRPNIGDHHNAEVINNKLYLFGGLGAGSPGEVQIGTLSGGRSRQLSIVWTKGSESPVRSGSGASAVLDGRVYLCGGIRSGGTIPACTRYDPGADTWAAAVDAPPPLLHGRNHAASCTDGSKFLVIGGRIGGNRPGQGFDENQLYIPGGSWTFGKPIPLPRKCYVFGGEVQPNTPPSPAKKINSMATLYRTDIYNVDSDTWSLGTDMTQGLHGIFPVMRNGKVYIGGGGTQAGRSFSTVFFEYTPE